MNKIIFINGTYGVGKTTVAKSIECINNKIKCLDPDAYYYELLKKYGPFIGWPAQTSILLIKYLREIIEENIKYKDIVIPMTLTTDYSKKELLEYYQSYGIAEVIHIILCMDKDALVKRIKNDASRDQEFALQNIDGNIKYLNDNYYNAIRIHIDSLNAENLAKKILKISKINNDN